MNSIEDVAASIRRVIKSLVLASVLATASAAHADGPVVFPKAEWQTATPQSQGINPDNLEKALAHLRDICGEDAAKEVVLIRNGYVLWQGENVARQRLVWSCTKSYLSTCLGLLWDDGRLTPGDLASKYNPALAEKYPAMTLEHLATFTSGYASDPNNALKPIDPMYPPGAAFHYSSQSDLLSSLLTKIAGRSLESLFFERIATPVGITREDMDWGELTEVAGVPVNGGSGFPGSGVRINALGMARFGWLYCNDGVWDGRRRISDKYIQYATVSRTATTLPPHNPKDWYPSLSGNYGLNWWTNGPKPDGTLRWPHAPARMFVAQGNRNNNCFVIPEWQMVFVRLGGDKNVTMELYDRVFELLDPTKQSVTEAK